MATISKENYLKTIFMQNSLNGKMITSSELAKELNVSKAAISEMANKLSQQGYIEYRKFKGIKLLAKGKKIAIDVIRKHRLWELFLIETLGLSWDEVHAEAEKLEHCTTINLIDKIDEHLNFPSLDPHGEPIPNKRGEFRAVKDDIPMKECSINKKYLIVRVNDKSDELMKYLSKISISLNKEISILDKINFDGSILININKTKQMLSEKIIENIFVREIENDNDN
ncbi:MAG: metal-dependent transcriptional regulator [Ignavibacteriae bacterium]|nr:metal-dependent transcriptional regulator [Ignavibacteriota bacterium]